MAHIHILRVIKASNKKNLITIVIFFLPNNVDFFTASALLLQLVKITQKFAINNDTSFTVLV